MRTVQDVLGKKGREVFSISPEKFVYDAIKLMAEKSIGALLVMEGEKLAGILSERDYARKVILQGKSSRETPVRDIMSSKVITVPPATKIEQCMALMTESRIRHLPVVDGERVVGIVSIGDLVKAVIEEQKFKIEQLEHYIGT